MGSFISFIFHHMTYSHQDCTIREWDQWAIRIAEADAHPVGGSAAGFVGNFRKFPTQG